MRIAGETFFAKIEGESKKKDTKNIESFRQKDRAKRVL